MSKFKVGDKVKASKIIRVPGYKPIPKRSSGKVYEVLDGRMFDYEIDFENYGKVVVRESEIEKRLW